MYKKAQAANAPKKKNLVVMTKGKGGKAPKGQKAPTKWSTLVWRLTSEQKLGWWKSQNFR